MKITKETLTFLKDLKKNNDRDWFNKNKDRYIAANENFTSFVQTIIDSVAKFDKTMAGLDAKKSVFRIYKDVRFSKDKSPYKTNLGASIPGKGKTSLITGYYLHIEPGASFLAGGAYMPEPDSIKAIRKEISANGKSFLKIINDKTFKNLFNIEGEKLVNVPQGFDKEDPMGEYLKYKAIVMFHKMDDKTVLSENFAGYITKVFKAMVPLNSFLNEAVL